MVQTLALHETGPFPATVNNDHTPMALLSSASLNIRPLHSLGYAVIPFAAFVSALIYIRDDVRYMRFLHGLIGSAAAVTLFGICEYLLSPQTLLLQPKPHYLNSFTGTFVNPNTAATYFGIMLLLSLSVCLRQFDKIRAYQLMFRVIAGSTDVRLFVAYSILAVVFLLALLLTRSRGGILSTLPCVVLLTSAFGLSTWRQHQSRIRLITTGTLSAAVTIALFVLYGGLFLTRLNVEGLDDGGRICTYQATWHAITENLWLGTGIGSFQDVFPAYRSPECGLNGYWEMAHSVFLEAWLSLGAVFFVCLSLVYYQLIKTYVYGLQTRRRYRFVSLAALAILLLLTLHSLVDFSLQIPAVAIVAAAVLGAGCAVSLAQTRVHSQRPVAMPAAELQPDQQWQVRFGSR
jgi:hypothetical protein